MSTTEQSRQHRRHSFHASCIARSVEDGRLVADRTLDLSYAGVRLGAVGTARIGERIELSLEIPGSRVWVGARGRIERVLTGRRAGDDGASLGVHIEQMHGFDRLMLATIVRGYPVIEATRGGVRDYAGTVARIASHG